MRSIWLGVLVLFATATSAQEASPPTLPAQPVTENYFGTKVVDRFRFIEKLDPTTLAWMRAQAAHTRRTLEAIPGRSELVSKMEALSGSIGLIGNPEWAGDRLFYTTRLPGATQSSLMVRDPNGKTRALVDTTALIATRGHPVAIDGFEPSRDGRFAAVRISDNGSENSMLTVIDAANGKTVAGPIRMGPFTSTSWDVDGKSLFFSRMPDPATTPEADRYKNSEILYWQIGSDPRIVVSARRRLGPTLAPQAFPSIFTPRGTGRAILIVSDGVADEFEAYEAPRTDAAAGRAKWRRIASLDDAVTGIFGAPDGLTFLTHKDTPGYKVTHTTWAGNASTAQTILGSQPGVFLQSMRGARDGIYVAGRERLSGAVWRITSKGAERLKLPQVGSVAALEAESDRDGALITLSGPATPDTTYQYRRDSSFRDLRLERRPASFDPNRYRVDLTDAVAADGVKVPMLILTRSGPRKPGPFVLEAYGAYGVVDQPLFFPLRIASVDAGVGHAQCGVRGGGEYGDAWRLAGKGANKPNSWRDAIACAQALIAAGYTTPSQLAIRGGSMGGIVVGRAVTERPELFAAAISAVGVSNPLRNETTAGGAANINEIGSVATEPGFRALLAMDSYQAIRDGVKLPPFLVTTGLKDARVPPWQPAKFVARLQEAGNTAFLRIDEQAGHGQGATLRARAEEQADIVAFILWNAGVPGWQPTR